MANSDKRMRHIVSLLFIFTGVAVWLCLPGLPFGRGNTAGNTTNWLTARRQSGLDERRQAAMERLYTALKAGATFAQEEADILRKFGSDYSISELEADIVISRALYEYYITGSELSK